jgi:hypothetical protein
VVPQDEVAGEEDAGECAHLPGADRQPAVPALLATGQQRQHGQGEQAAQAGCRGGRDVGQPDEGR